MAEPATADHRRATAERNVEAILDAAEALLGRGDALTIAAVAGASGLSRVTVYAHFANAEALLDVVVRRSVGRVAAAFATVDLDGVDGLDALGRMVDVGWQALGELHGVARASGSLLSAEARRDAHREVLDLVDRVVQRGRSDGSIRADVPAAWAASVFYALIHTAVDDVRAGRIDADAAGAALALTVRDALSARSA